ncbi:protein PLANT CADMIUM RESISTANCE 3-like [Nymphaea colorata]|nr:protein PLANT CADMIUM RESISTANCE 3-like [Nymphaea colorata]
MYPQGGMKQAAAAASSSSSEKSPYYGEPALGNPTAWQMQYEYDYRSDGDLQPRMVFPTRWSTTLFQCCIDPSNCFLACLCPCVTFGRIAEIVDRGSTSCIAGACLYEAMKILTCCGCLYSAFFRAKLRAQYRLPENPAPDWAVHCVCEPCALTQEYRELQRRGFDPSIGWEENLERQKLKPTLPPVVAPDMMRQQLQNGQAIYTQVEPMTI